ncbi:cytochrome c [Rhodocaloribacter litoris]|uniref:c-type cytochrome n=1 Tax=Rhodocaloribacter litoris TaxID=2558931 RepID=UPI00141E5606|nr:c-type cytochrome [Rhodocaloribacter litoris]QXD15934.1 cytochrome c [Rhodocaloribacter litoris]
MKIFAFTILVSAFYSYVGQWVPQKETYPPETVELSADMTTEELVAAGQEIVAGKGTCLGCHTIGQEGGALRFPDLGNIGAVAGTRREGYSDVEYLAESLYEPNVFIVEGFNPGMPAVHRPPIGLTDQEILAVIAYLQSLGGTPTVTLATELRWQGQAPATPAAPATPSPGGAEAMDGPALVQAYLCNTCHSFDAPTPGAGPSLYDVGRRLSKAEIYEAIMEPDAVVAEGYAPGVMGATLNATGFYDRITSAQLKTLVDYLASLQGG